MKGILKLSIFIFVRLNILAADLNDHTSCQPMNVILKYSNELRKKNIKLNLYGFAKHSDVNDNKIHEINLTYSIDKRMKLNEAREFFYSVIDGLIAEINKNESIRSQFHRYPVSYSDFYFILAFDYENKGFLKCGDVDMIVILENEISYYIVENDGETSDLEMEQVIPDVYTIKKVTAKTRRIVKKLPEEK